MAHKKTVFRVIAGKPVYVGDERRRRDARHLARMQRMKPIRLSDITLEEIAKRGNPERGGFEDALMCAELKRLLDIERVCRWCGSWDNCPHCDSAHQADLRKERRSSLDAYI